MADFQLELDERGETLVAKLIGEASLATNDAMEHGLMGVYARRPKYLVLDLSQLDFIASLAMGNLVSLQQRIVQRNGGWVRAAAANPDVRKAFEHARLDKLFDLADSVEDALQRDPS